MMDLGCRSGIIASAGQFTDIPYRAMPDAGRV